MTPRNCTFDPPILYIHKWHTKTQKTVDSLGFFRVLNGENQKRQVLQVIQVIQ